MTPGVPEGVYKTKSAAKSWEAEAEHVFGVSNGGGGGNNRLDRIPHGRFSTKPWFAAFLEKLPYLFRP